MSRHSSSPARARTTPSSFPPTRPRSSSPARERISFPEEIDALRSYLHRGGKAIFLVDPTRQASTPNLVAFLLELGIAVGEDVVVDRFSVPPVYPVVSDYGRHPIVESFAKVRSLFPLVRTVARAEEVPEGADVRELFTTPDSESWAETNLDELSERGGPAPGQKVGPLSLAVAATLPVEESGDEGEPDAPEASARVVVVGDSDFITNDLAQAPVLNANLFLNMVNWVTQDEDLMGIRPSEPERSAHLSLAPAILERRPALSTRPARRPARDRHLRLVGAPLVTP